MPMFARPGKSAPTTPPALRADGRLTIVAEAAQGFEGDLSLAQLLVRGAAAADADLVKLQLVYGDELTTPAHHHHQLFRSLEMSDASWRAVADEARNAGIGMSFDVFGPRSLALAIACGASAVKIHASDVFNQPLVESALAQAPHVFLSIGGVHPDEVSGLVDQYGADGSRLTLLYGFQAEPTCTEDNHLSRLATLRRAHPHVGLGFMDHTDGESDESAWLAALALPYGVRLIEKHLTLDRLLALEDFVSAVAPDAFRRFVARLRAAESAVGTGDLALSPAELRYRATALKVVVARHALAPGDPVEAADVVLLRTPVRAGRDPLLRVGEAIGRRTRVAIEAHAPIHRDDLQ